MYLVRKSVGTSDSARDRLITSTKSKLTPVNTTPAMTRNVIGIVPASLQVALPEFTNNPPNDMCSICRAVANNSRAATAGLVPLTMGEARVREGQTRMIADRLLPAVLGCGRRKIDPDKATDWIEQRALCVVPSTSEAALETTPKRRSGIGRNAPAVAGDGESGFGLRIRPVLGLLGHGPVPPVFTIGTLVFLPTSLTNCNLQEPTI